MNIDLLHYIQQARKSGIADDKIREGLLQSGWLDVNINEAMINAPAVATPPVKPKAMMSKSLAVILISIAIAGASYIGVAYYFANYQDLPIWPFENFIEPIPTATPRPDLETKLSSEVPADWKTYRNEEYGFEFKYPGDWQLIDGKELGHSLESKGQITLVNKAQDSSAISVLSLSPLGVGDEKTPLDSFCDTREDIIFASKRAIQCINSAEFYEQKAIRLIDPVPGWEKDNLIYYDITKFEGEDTNNLIPQVNQILSTFRFIE